MTNKITSMLKTLLVHFCFLLFLLPSAQFLVLKFVPLKVAENTTALEIFPISSLVDCVLQCSASSSCSVVEFFDNLNGCASLDIQSIALNNATKNVYGELNSGKADDGDKII